MIGLKLLIINILLKFNIVGLQRKSVNYSIHYFEKKKRILHLIFALS